MIACRGDLKAYLDADQIECLVCERRLTTLGRHLRLAHGMTPAEYRTAYGMPAGTPLAGRLYRAARSRIMRENIEAGALNHDHLPRAVAAASVADRGRRAEWERAEQGDRAAAIPHPTLPPGARSPNGRDMDRARDYQRRRRAALKPRTP